MAGAVAIVVVLMLIPVLVLMSGGVVAAVLGTLLGRDADARAAHGGAGAGELLALDDGAAGAALAPMPRQAPASEVLPQAIVRYAVARVRLAPPPLDHPRPAAELRAMAGHTIT